MYRPAFGSSCDGIESGGEDPPRLEQVAVVLVPNRRSGSSRRDSRAGLPNDGAPGRPSGMPPGEIGYPGPVETTDAIRVGVSACLLGEEVRWDGGARLVPWLRDVFGRRVELLPICPEVEVGMGVPRPPVDLYRLGGELRMIARKPEEPVTPGRIPDGRDWTEELRAFSTRRLAALPPLDGYVWKAKSPSCGLGSTRCWGPDGPPETTSGLFAAAFVAARPHVPCVEETGLTTPEGRDAFVERVMAAARARLAGGR
jgi:uncharacterized protein YbbK (DUF523 family)